MAVPTCWIASRRTFTTSRGPTEWTRTGSTVGSSARVATGRFLAVPLRGGGAGRGAGFDGWGRVREAAVARCVFEERRWTCLAPRAWRP